MNRGFDFQTTAIIAELANFLVIIVYYSAQTLSNPPTLGADLSVKSPGMSRVLPGRGVVGQQIDRCISSS